MEEDRIRNPDPKHLKTRPSVGIWDLQKPRFRFSAVF
jgi:hypothetical protein